MEKVRYELWAVGYDEEECCMDYEELLAEFPHTPEGKEEAIDLLRNVKWEGLRISSFSAAPESIVSVCLAVEEIGKFTETDESPVDVCGTRWLDKPEETV